MAQKTDLPPIDRREEVRVDQDAGGVRRQRVVRDAAAERMQTISRVNQLIWLIFGVIMGLIAFRIVLRLLVANPGNTFAEFVYSITDPFLQPFYGLLNTPTTTTGMAFELSSLVALFVYAIIAALITTLVRILFSRSRVRKVQTYERD